MSRHPIRTARQAATLLGLALSGCGGSDPQEPGWLSLAHGFEPLVVTDDPGREATAPDRRFRLAPSSPRPGTLSATRILSAEDWSWIGVENIWEAHVGYVWEAAPNAHELILRQGKPGRTWKLDAERELMSASLGGAAPAPGLYAAIHGRVFASFEEGERPSAGIEFTFPMNPGQAVGGRWRVPVGPGRADGLFLWGQQPVELILVLEDFESLRFGTYVPAVMAGSDIRFRVSIAEALVYESRFDPGAPGGIQWHGVALTDAPRGPVPVVFEVVGPPFPSAILCPTLVPSDPPDDPRPDVVVFLADTFRADNLACYGSELDLSPRIDGFARESLIFSRAWSPASWTLPAHASLMTAAWPDEHGANHWARRMSDELVTLAEALCEAGYRTGAITESGFVSASFGFDQGFELFDESSRKVRDTVARARSFLTADDGRPTFLFVQTFRVHAPYVIDAETFEAHAERLGIEGGRNAAPQLDWALGWSPMVDTEVTEADRRIAEDLEPHYRGQVLDLDRAFGQLLDWLESSGADRNTWVVFTSDHGEAFGEHGLYFHNSHVWEEMIRIPLLIRAPLGSERLRPGVVQYAASLVDLPRTIAELADIEPAPSWRGQSLLGLTTERATFSIGGSAKRSRVMALIEGEHKSIVDIDDGLGDTPRILGAFDLSADPGETRNWADSDAAWPAEFLERILPLARQASLPLIDPVDADIPRNLANRLRDMGYAGD